MPTAARPYGSWMDYDFPRGVRVVPRADRLNLLSVSTVTLAYGLEDRSASFGVERTLGRMLLDIDLGHDRSAIAPDQIQGIPIHHFQGIRFQLQ